MRCTHLYVVHVLSLCAQTNVFQEKRARDKILDNPLKLADFKKEFEDKRKRKEEKKAHKAEKKAAKKAKKASKVSMPHAYQREDCVCRK